MKKTICAIALLSTFSAYAQPAGYYDAALGLNGQSLRAALSSIIRPHTELSYTPGLWNAYNTTDKKPSGKVWDMYSDRPGGTPAYEYTLGADQCGSVTPSTENSCYNREHTWPQSKFSSEPPMQTDLFIVYPSDYFVNFSRGDRPYGKVGSATQTFTNGGKIGNNVYPGAPSASCYEPIDSFKGDLARAYFYVSTCYRNDSMKFITWEIATLVSLKSWSAQMLLEWHHLDPVSKKEIDRNNAVYALQGNRNPFIDRPQFADCIWGTSDCSATYVTGTDKEAAIDIYPNPVSGNLTVTTADKTMEQNIIISDITGRIVYNSSFYKSTSVSTIDFISGLYFVNIKSVNTNTTYKISVAH
jgi:endonuclease I